MQQRQGVLAMFTVARALQILALLAEGPLTLAEIAERTGIHKSTASRLMKTMQGQGFARMVQGRYRLGLAVFSLAHAAAEQLDVRETARPHLERLSELTSETIHLGVLDGAEVVYIDKIDSKYPLRMYSRIGRRAPAYCTGVGKALLAFLPARELARVIQTIRFRPYTSRTITDPSVLATHLEQVRQRGYAVDDCEHEEDICCIAAPILDVNRMPAAAISITAPRWRMPREQLESYVPQLLAATQKVSADLGYTQPRRRSRENKQADTMTGQHLDQPGG